MTAESPDGRKWYDSVMYGPGGQEFLKRRAIDDAQKDEIIGRLAVIWKENPTLRLTQLIINVLGKDPYYIEDFDAIDAIEEFYGREDV